MGEIDEDKIDLKPYFKLFRKTLKSVEKWIYKKIAFVILCFIVLMGVFYNLDALKKPRYKVSTIIDKEFVSSEQLKSVLHSTKVNIDAGYTPKFFESFQNKIGDQVKIFKLDYAILTSFKDSIIMKRDEGTLDELENDGPAKIELVTNFDNDSIGHLFIEYLNNHSYIKSIRNSQVDLYNGRLSSLNKEINEIDSVISKLLVRDENDAVYKKENSCISFNLFEHKDELILEREEISNTLKFMNSSEIYSLGEIHQPRELGGFSIFSVKTIIKYLFLSFFIVWLTSLVIQRYKNRTTK